MSLVLHRVRAPQYCLKICNYLLFSCTYSKYYQRFLRGFLKIAKVNSQQEKPICPNRKKLGPAKYKKSPIRKNKLPPKISCHTVSEVTRFYLSPFKFIGNISLMHFEGYATVPKLKFRAGGTCGMIRGECNLSGPKLIDLHNCPYHTQPHLITTNYMYTGFLSSTNQRQTVPSVTQQQGP